MKPTLIIACISFLFVNCTSKTEFEYKKYMAVSSTNCNSNYDCAKITLNVIEAKQKNTISDSINTTIFNVLRNCVYVGENPKEVSNTTQLANSFITTFRQVKKDLAQNNIQQVTSWEANATTKINYQSNQMLNIVIDYYVFSGGAHGYGAISSLLFNPKTGKILPQEAIFSNLNETKKLVEEKFRDQLNIKKNASLNEEGYFFEKDIFVLPKNILFTKKGLQFHYNQYEVASYANGPIDVELPYEIIEKYLLVK